MVNRMVLNEKRKKCLHIAFYGEIDSLVSKQYRYELVDLFEEKEYQAVLFDFTQVSFIDSSGIGLILGRYNQITRQGGYCYLLAKKPLIHRLFELSGLFTIMEEVDSIKQWEKKAGKLYESHGSKL